MELMELNWMSNPLFGQTDYSLSVGKDITADTLIDQLSR